MRPRAMLAALLACCLLVTACSDGPGGSAGSDSDAGGNIGSDGGEDVVVFAAASLTGAFTRMGNAVEDEHPGLQVRFSFGGSSSLAPQATSGAPVDVFASANPDVMQLLVDGGAVTDTPELFARNQLEIAVPTGNPADVDELEDLVDPDVKVAVCAPQVPCGAAAQKVFKVAGLGVAPVTYEQDVKAVASKVQLGEVDAGLVYETDVLALRGKVQGVEFEESDQAVNDYMIAPLGDAPNPRGAREFIEMVGSIRGREIMRDAGFDVP